MGNPLRVSQILIALNRKSVMLEHAKAMTRMQTYKARPAQQTLIAILARENFVLADFVNATIA